jgi:hypothetical protein
MHWGAQTSRNDLSQTASATYLTRSKGNLRWRCGVSLNLTLPDFEIRLAGSVAVVSGSSRNIGRRVLLDYAMEGADVLANDTANEAAQPRSVHSLPGDYAHPLSRKPGLPAGSCGVGFSLRLIPRPCIQVSVRPQD